MAGSVGLWYEAVCRRSLVPQLEMALAERHQERRQYHWTGIVAKLVKFFEVI